MGDDDEDDPPTEMFMSPVAGQHSAEASHGDAGAGPMPPMPNFGAPLPLPSTGIGSSAASSDVGAPPMPAAAAAPFARKKTLMGLAPFSPEAPAQPAFAAPPAPPAQDFAAPPAQDFAAQSPGQEPVAPFAATAQQPPIQAPAIAPPGGDLPPFGEPLVPQAASQQMADPVASHAMSAAIPGMPGALSNADSMSSSPSRLSTGSGMRMSVAGSSPTSPVLADPDAAPGWMKALAFATVASALLVLAVLGWLVSQRL
jgi:hypothetical protein